MNDDKEPDLSDDARVLLARKIVPYIPWVGPAATIYVERKINDAKFNRLESLIAELSKRTPIDAELDALTGQSVFQSAAEYTINSPEAWKPYVYARIISFQADTISKAIQRLAIDHTNQLSDFDFSVFVSQFASELLEHEDASKLRKYLIDMADADAVTKSLENIGLRNLVRLGFIEENSDKRYGGYRIASVGKFIVEAVNS